MSFNPESLRQALATRPRVARVVVAEVKGSAPREVGAAMLVWEDGQSGTIGGGALEYAAAAQARAALAHDRNGYLETFPLGPALGQCCGGSVRLLTEFFDIETVQAIDKTSVFARPCGGARPSLRLKRALAQARNSGSQVAPALIDGWMVEPVIAPAAPLWIYGAGHVGRALIDVITPLEDFVITWVDTSPDRFPEPPEGVTILPASAPHRVVAHAPRDAHHLILTYSHALDLELCHALLGRGFASAGLIGSASKWARFRKRLHALGHSLQAIDTLTCPIGMPSLGKQPQAIAIGVASQLISIIKTQANRDNDHEREPNAETCASHPCRVTQGLSGGGGK